MPRRDRSGKFPQTYNVIMVTGASGGIGAAIARHYARPGVMLVLWGRDPSRLAHTAQTCVGRGAAVQTRSIDLRDGLAALAALRADDAQHPLELVVLGAGVSDIRNADEASEVAETVLETGLVNFAVPAALATEITARMAVRGRGHVAMIGSVAAFHNLPFATAYSGSKAGLARFCHALRLSLRNRGVGLTLISPGFVDTAMSRRLIGPRPFLVTPEGAAARIARAIGRGDADLVFPGVFRLLRALDTFLPRRVSDAVMVRLKAAQKRQEHLGA